jgi:ectoine hydroxylase-related dioxygenase (phytanoyl-CoA dioxygenase family)
MPAAPPGFCLSIPLEGDTSSSSCDSQESVPQHLKDAFADDGFVVLPHVFDKTIVDALNDRLEEVLRGRYDRNQAPDKIPRLIKDEQFDSDRKVNQAPGGVGDKTTTKGKTKTAAFRPLGFSGNLNNVRVLQVINVHKSDRLFRALATAPRLGQLVAELAGWSQGARLAQDQVWAKPPGAAPLVFHRDSPYFMFQPANVITVWVALDDMDEEIGPLQYVRGSHKWGDGRVGSANQFFQPDGGDALLKSAAERAGISYVELEKVSMAGLARGGISIHDGKTWHGSAKNESKTRPRRGLGLHFVPAQARFTQEANKSRLWRPYVDSVDDVSHLELPEEDFPIVWRPHCR